MTKSCLTDLIQSFYLFKYTSLQVLFSDVFLKDRFREFGGRDFFQKIDQTSRQNTFHLLITLYLLLPETMERILTFLEEVKLHQNLFQVGKHVNLFIDNLETHLTITFEVLSNR